MQPVGEEMKSLALSLSKHCRAYRGGSTKRSLFELFITIVPFFALTGIMLYGVDQSQWWSLILIFPAGAFLVRLFIIQHDCGHGSYFKARWVNDALGRALSVLTLTPYTFWYKAHAKHHATSGNLDKRGFGDIVTLTVAEYLARTKVDRLKYRIFRNPVFLFIIGMPYQFIIGHRLPWGLSVPFAKVWRSIMTSNVVLFTVYALVVALFGWKALLVLLPTVAVASWVGGWMFFVQHQFEGTHWTKAEDWDFRTLALIGSSYYVLPTPLRWMTGNIGLHHIHHLSGAIPFYRLKECLDASPQLQSMSRLTLRESFGCVRLALWDEKIGKLVGFRDLKTV